MPPENPQSIGVVPFLVDGSVEVAELRSLSGLHSLALSSAEISFPNTISRELTICLSNQPHTAPDRNLVWPVLRGNDAAIAKRRNARAV